MIVCLDAGHGGKDPGAVNNNLKLKESTITLNVVQKISGLLKKKGINVILTRSKDEYVTLAARCLVANRNKADIFVSVHCNSAANNRAVGIETYCYKVGGKGEQLAKLIQNNLINATKTLNRGVKTANFYVLRNTVMPAVLTEIGFISNDDEARKLNDNNYQSQIAQAIAEAVLQYAKQQ